MSLKPHIIILPRREENLMAVLKCHTRGVVIDVMKDLIKGITEWIKVTKKGKEEWDLSSKNFNIGDLSTLSLEAFESLIPFLQSVGIYCLDIDIYGTEDYTPDYVYDSVLVNELDLEEN